MTKIDALSVFFPAYKRSLQAGNKKKINLSVFFPAYNEEENIKSTVLKARDVLEKLAGKWEIIVVNDGSKDKTGEVAGEIAERINKVWPRQGVVRVINQPNTGYGGALKTGFRSAKYAWVAFADSDGQFDFSELSKFLEHKDEADLVLGYRLKRADSFARKVFTFGWSSLARLLLGLDVKDYSCGFKLIKKEVFDSIQPLVGEQKVTQIEMLVKAKRKGYKFAQVGVHHYPREFGKQTGSNLKVVFRSILDLLKLWKKLS